MGTSDLNQLVRLESTMFWLQNSGCADDAWIYVRKGNVRLKVSERLGIVS